MGLKAVAGRSRPGRCPCLKEFLGLAYNVPEVHASYHHMLMASYICSWWPTYAHGGLHVLMAAYLCSWRPTCAHGDLHMLMAAYICSWQPTYAHGGLHVGSVPSAPGLSRCFLPSTAEVPPPILPSCPACSPPPHTNTHTHTCTWLAPGLHLQACSTSGSASTAAAKTSGSSTLPAP